MIDRIKTELDTDPLGRDYENMTDAQVAASLSALDRTRLTPIPSTELLAWSAGSSAGDRPRRIKMQEAADSHQSEQIKAIAQAAITMVNRDSTLLDLSLPDRVGMMDALVAGGVFSAADRASLFALGTQSISRAAELGLGTVEATHVRDARTL